VKIVWTPNGFAIQDYQVFKHPNNTNDDYFMMQQMFKKRFGNEKYSKQDLLPDFVLIDGGAGQFSVSTEHIPVQHFALSKHVEGDKLHNENGVMEISQKCRLWLMMLRDEAHRFAITSHRKIKTDNMIEL